MIAPSKLPTIFNGDKAVIYGIFKSKPQPSALSGTATLFQTKGDLKHTIPFEIPAPSKDQGTLSMPIVHHLAAKSLIKDWQAGEGLKGLPETRRKEAIIKLSIESSVVSAHTAYIAVDEEQDKPIEGAIKTWDVTAMMADRHLYYRSQGRYDAAMPMHGGIMLAESSMPSHSGCCAGGAGGAPRRLQPTRGPPPEPQGDLPPSPPATTASSSSHNPQTGELSTLISLQQADGNWKLDAALASVLSKILQQLEGACPVDCKGDIICAVWATVLALVFLEAKHSAKHDEWELVAMKAQFWLQGQTFPAGTDLDSFMEAAKKCFGTQGGV